MLAWWGGLEGKSETYTSPVGRMLAKESSDVRISSVMVELG